MRRPGECLPGSWSAQNSGRISARHSCRHRCGGPDGGRGGYPGPQNPPCLPLECLEADDRGTGICIHSSGGRSRVLMARLVLRPAGRPTLFSPADSLMAFVFLYGLPGVAGLHRIAQTTERSQRVSPSGSAHPGCWVTGSRPNYQLRRCSTARSSTTSRSGGPPLDEIARVGGQVRFRYV